MLEQIVQVFPMTLLYWLKFALSPRSFIVLRQKISMPLADQGISEALDAEISAVVWGFYGSRTEWDVNDERIVTDLKHQMLTMRKLWIVKGIFSGKDYKIGLRSWAMGFAT